MPETAKLGLVLLLMCAISTGLLGYVNAVTEGRIAQIEADASGAARKETMPEADDITEKVSAEETERIASMITSGGTLDEIYVAKAQGVKIGYTFATHANGFGGAVNVITGISASGSITEIRITSQSETAGLGANATDPSFTGRYSGKSASEQLKVSKDGGTIDAISGATITSRAVTSAVNTATQAYSQLEGGGQ